MLGRLGLRARLAIVSIVLLLVAGFAIERLSSAELETAMIQRTTGDLFGELGLVEDAAQSEAGRPGGPDWPAFAHRAGARIAARVTLVAADGTVIGDSEVAREDLGRLENHAAREEIATALASGSGSAVRASPTLGVRMIYAARRYPAPADGIVVVRLAVPLRDLDGALASSRRLLAFGTALAVALAVLVNLVGTYRITRPIRDLTNAALAMAGGNLDVRAATRGADDLARLGAAFNHLAGELEQSFGELTADRDLLAGILDGMNEGVLVVDDERRVVLANRALRAMVLLDGDAIGKPVIEVIRSAALASALEDAARGEAVAREMAIGPLVSKRVLVRASRLASSPQNHTLLAVVHDVTDLRRLETIRTDFVANVSHELRTPITAIATSAETLLQGALADPVDAAEFVGVIERHATRLRQLVDDLLDLSKIEAKGFRLGLADADIGPIAEHVVGLMLEPARGRRVDLALERPREAVHANVDRRAFEQVLMNLLENAIKYAGEKAHVNVAVKRAGRHVELVVSDDGPGIPVQHLDRIFERFYRVDAGRSRELGGTGLGLSIVKHLVELMKGTVEVDSAPGKGARFTVRLPAST